MLHPSDNGGYSLAILLFVTAIPGLAQTDKSTEPTAAEPPAVDMVIKKKGRRLDVVYGESVKRVFAPRINDWVVLDQQRLIMYVTRSRPYLVTLQRKANGLNKTTVIGLERRDNSIDARFDQIYIEGFPYAIKRIEKLTVDTARRLRGIEAKPEPESEEPADDHSQADS